MTVSVAGKRHRVVDYPAHDENSNPENMLKNGSGYAPGRMRVILVSKNDIRNQSDPPVEEDEMKTNRVIFLFGFAAILAVALFVINSAQAVANIAATRAARADQADILRWVAMGEYYTGQPASAPSFDAQMSRDIGAARWQALGESYLKFASQTRNVDAARWQALGEAYLKNH